MYSLQLTDEQREFRDTVRDFVASEIKPAILHPDALQGAAGQLRLDLLGRTAEMGLRALMLSEANGGAGGNCLTACIVAEELAAGDVGIAATLAETWTLAQYLFDTAMSPAQRARFLPAFTADNAFHLAYAGLPAAADSAWRYHRPFDAPLPAPAGITAVRQAGGDWVLDGESGFVVNAPVAKLFAVQVRAQGSGDTATLLIARDHPGVSVREPHEGGRGSGPGGEPLVKWYHGSGGQIVLAQCRVAAADVLPLPGAGPDAGAARGRGSPQAAAMNIGVGRAAFEAAVDYARLRVQGAKPIIQHQAIGTILAKVATKIEVARNMVRNAAWAADHPEAYADRTLSDLPLQTVAAAFTAEAMYEVAEDSAECFGAMGVMLDMPLPKYVHETRVFLHTGRSTAVEHFRIAEAVAGYARS
jgi:alkylation response protein AidB-like acyl-CoA dehydrogenase